MNKLLEEEYFHIGTDRIYKELWLNIQMEQIHDSCLISYGGLFTSHQNKYTLSDWISYKLDCNNPEFLNYMYSLKSILIKFKEHSKFLSVNTENDYKNLKDSGFVKTLEKPITVYKYFSPDIYKEVLDYEKIAEFYDLLYINPYAHEYLRPFSINTMYALNPDCIDYYKQLEVDYENHTILNESKPMYIEEPSKEYYKLLNYIRNLFPNIVAPTYEEYLYKLSKIKNSIIEEITENESIDFSFLNSTEINKEELINIIIRNIYKEKYLEAQKRLLKK